MRSMAVVVGHVFGEDPREVTLADDEYPVGAFAAYGAYPPLGERVGARSQLHRMRTIGTDVSG